MSDVNVTVEQIITTVEVSLTAPVNVAVQMAGPPGVVDYSRVIALAVAL